MQLYLLDSDGNILGGCSLENTHWSFTEVGLLNQDFFAISIDRSGDIAQFKIVDGTGKEVRRETASTSNPTMVAGNRLQFAPGTFTISIGQLGPQENRYGQERSEVPQGQEEGRFGDARVGRWPPPFRFEEGASGEEPEAGGGNRAQRRAQGSPKKEKVINRGRNVGRHG